MPSLQRFYEKVKDNNVSVLAITVGQNEDDVFPFISEVNPKPTFPILYDKTSVISTYWGIKAMPTTFIVNKKGHITHYAIGGRNFDNPDFIKMILSLK